MPLRFGSVEEILTVQPFTEWELRDSSTLLFVLLYKLLQIVLICGRKIFFIFFVVEFNYRKVSQFVFCFRILLAKEKGFGLTAKQCSTHIHQKSEHHVLQGQKPAFKYSLVRLCSKRTVLIETRVRSQRSDYHSVYSFRIQYLVATLLCQFAQSKSFVLGLQRILNNSYSFSIQLAADTKDAIIHGKQNKSCRKSLCSQTG